MNWISCLAAPAPRQRLHRRFAYRPRLRRSRWRHHGSVNLRSSPNQGLSGGFETAHLQHGAGESFSFSGLVQITASNRFWIPDIDATLYLGSTPVAEAMRDRSPVHPFPPGK